MSAPVLKGAALAELLRRFPHEPNAQLAADFGLVVRQVQHIGFSNGLGKTAECRSRAARHRQRKGPPLSLQVENVVKAAGEHGVDITAACAALPSETYSAVFAAINKLTSARYIWRGGKRRASRWFATEADAQAFTRRALTPVFAPPPAPAAADKPSTPVVTVAASRGPAHAPGEPHIPAGLQVVRGKPVPGPEGRWHTDAAPIFSALKPGQYPDAPSTWAAAATGARA